jgi:DNA-binding response OmpR family regulator
MRSARLLRNPGQARSGHPTEETRLRAESSCRAVGPRSASRGPRWRERCLENAASALASLDVVPADLAIVDLMMPGTSGIELARLVRERHPATRILLTSAYHLSERQLLRADCGAVGFVPKPYDLAELARFIHAKLAAPGSVSSVERMGTCDDGEDRAPAIAI